MVPRSIATRVACPAPLRVCPSPNGNTTLVIKMMPRFLRNGRPYVPRAAASTASAASAVVELPALVEHASESRTLEPLLWQRRSRDRRVA